MFRNIAEACISELKTRKGFDWFWGDLDEEIREEIFDALSAKIEQCLADDGR